MPRQSAVPARYIARAIACIGCLGTGLAVLPGTALGQTCTQNTTSDWIVSALAKDPLAAPLRPGDCAVVTQTPPDFGWPDMSSGTRYQVTLTYPDGRTKTLSSPINWMAWDETLPAGNYTWRIQATSGSTTQTSQPRRFTMDSGATTFLLPDATTLYNRAAAKPHPRGLPDATTLTTMMNQRQAGLKDLLAEVDGKVGRTPQSEPSSSSAGANWSDARDENNRTLGVALAWVVTKQSKYLNDAIIRLKNLASWNPNGATSYTVPGMDMGAREITWTMALVYDWLYPQLDSATRSAVQASLRTRTNAMYNDIIGSRSRVAVHPLDSHGNMTLTVLGTLSVLLAGDIPDAQNWARDALPASVNAVSPWGGDESGHANGTAQGSWDMGDSLVPWYVLRWAGGVDIAQKPWMRNWSRFITYFIPPGTPVGAFGDGAEVNRPENWSRFGKGAIWFAPTPLGRWYASQPTLQAEDPKRMEVMLAPPADYTSAPYPTGTPNSAVFRRIGWAAMHSDLSDPKRVSVYFKSSYYGAFNHGHADQNSFVINAGGQRLAIDSGYYDDYKTAHWWQWYKQTKAHNAITFDGGVGQTIFETDDKVPRGEITRYQTGSDFDIVTGDATPTYGGAVTKALRSLVYLRPNLVLVYDTLASNTARQWEWNIHSVNQMSSSSGTSATIQNGGQSLCVNVLGGPTTGFRQTNQFSANPTGSWAAQWHGTFYSTTKLAATEFVTLLNVGCSAATPAPTISKSGTTWTVNVAGKTLTLDNGVVTMAGVPTTPPTETTPPPTETTPPPTTTEPPPVVVPPPTPTSQPFTGTPIAVPGQFEAENFDKGGEGLGYHDITKGNTGGLYRRNEDVDLIASCDSAGGGYVINNFHAGEWLAYTINVASTARYDIALRLSSNYPTGAFHVEIDGVNVTGSLNGLKTGDWCKFQWMGKTGVPLTKGVHVMKVFADQQYFNLNSIRVTLSK